MNLFSVKVAVVHGVERVLEHVVFDHFPDQFHSNQSSAKLVERFGNDTASSF